MLHGDGQRSWLNIMITDQRGNLVAPYKNAGFQAAKIPVGRSVAKELDLNTLFPLQGLRQIHRPNHSLVCPLAKLSNQPARRSILRKERPSMSNVLAWEPMLVTTGSFLSHPVGPPTFISKRSSLKSGAWSYDLSHWRASSAPSSRVHC